MDKTSGRAVLRVTSVKSTASTYVEDVDKIVCNLNHINVMCVTILQKNAAGSGIAPAPLIVK